MPERLRGKGFFSDFIVLIRKELLFQWISMPSEDKRRWKI